MLIKMSQVNLVPITTSRPYGCFLPQCILADLYTSRWHIWPLRCSQTEIVFRGAPAARWPSCHHTRSLSVNVDHSITLLCLLFLFHFHLSTETQYFYPAFTASLHSHSCLDVKNRDPAMDRRLTQLLALDLFEPQRGITRCQRCSPLVSLQYLAAQGSLCVSHKATGLVIVRLGSCSWMLKVRSRKYPFHKPLRKAADYFLERLINRSKSVIMFPVSLL